jgi:hypothetical protein
MMRWCALRVISGDEMSAVARISQKDKNDLAGEYRDCLEAHLIEPTEEILNQAYEVGRKAVGMNLSLLDMSILHHKALYSLIRFHSPAAQPGIVERAAVFFSESRSPFERLLLRYPRQ